ncbi:Hypothetical predicted protein [Lecanosticta acicola]|uniref:Lytic polysaccharide monooxygenase n=1 Tax=Lecanosticta acicola TaxID=111012 RepID=A0AAI8Z6X6_9PEZI|nr:Hypothetical predicted protein [Lecanosticta acicola]
MSSRIWSKSASATLCHLLLSAAPALGHMEMSWPYPLHSKYDPENTYQNIDYSMTSPLDPDGSSFPCKGYQNDRPIRTTATYAAGSTYNMTLAGTATHRGGSCQISLSYDNGATFRVIKSVVGGCPLQSTYDFTIPSYAPTGEALLAWTWSNNEGNREYYMNCAEVNVITGATRRRRRQTYNSFESLPFIWKADLEGLNDCTTTEGEDPVYPNPGPDVQYGNGVSSSSTPSPGTCDSPRPYGKSYKDLGDSSEAPTAGSTPSSPSPDQNSTSMTRSAYYPGSTGFSSHGSDRAASPNQNPQELAVSAASQSTTTVYIDCTDTVTITVAATTPLPPTASSRPPQIIPSTTKPTPPLPTGPNSGSGSGSPNSPHPPYASGDVNRYLPCVPGTFLCTNANIWLTCDSNDGSSSVRSSETWVYLHSRPVAAGMMCLPWLSKYTGGNAQYAQQAHVARGSYRDDRVVRARPDGDCGSDGALRCTDGGRAFEVCDQGGWVQMGSVAAGTTCSNGAIVAA